VLSLTSCKIKLRKNRSVALVVSGLLRKYATDRTVSVPDSIVSIPDCMVSFPYFTVSFYII
ncbi:hypothetical protein, partial [Escherichia coli]|uniref:hypothetical protein n=1 Tax=Escherichia coli TaxID=562 RepID=UPI001BAEF3DE